MLDRKHVRLLRFTLSLSGMWAIANNSGELYTRCSKGLPATSSLKKLLDDQYAARKKQAELKSDLK